MKLDSTPRYLRITFRGGDGLLHRFTGMIHLDGPVVRGERKDDVKDGIRLNLFVGNLGDIVKIERQNPRYETWEELP